MERQIAGRERVRVTWEKRAGRIVLRRDARGRWVLTLPEGVPEKVGVQYLAGWQTEKDSGFEGTYAPGERHLLLGRRVVLGEDGVPAGEAFPAWRRMQAEALLQAQADRWTEAMGLPAVQVVLARMPGFWGKCRFDEGKIVMNELCARLPETECDALILHEVCHLRWHDHCPAFWQAMSACMPDWPAREGRLRSRALSPLPKEE